MARPLPTWSRPPTHAWQLDEIKAGHVVASHSLNDATKAHSATDNCSITFGRMDEPTVVDIVTAHESCSRLHARIAFDSNGTPWLRDLGSGNGTFVNERRLPPEACGKGEPATSRKGSRGVVLYPGDAIRFGASTRIYLLEGPEEFEREAIKLKQKMKEIAAAADTSDIASGEKEEDQSAKENDEGCGWGLADDVIPAEQEEKAQARDSDLPLPTIDNFFFSDKHKIPDSLHKLHGQYNTKMHKLQSIQTESQRIMAKENMGVELTEGQRGQLAKNQDRIAELEKSVAGLKEKIEDGMHTAIHGKDRANKKRRKEEDEYHGGDDDVDDFYDRTASSSKRQRNDEGGAQSEQSLIVEWKSLLDDRATHQRKVARALDRSEALQRQIDSSKEDDEDAFFLQNDLSLAKDTLSKATKSLEETEKELDETERLLKIVNPKLLWDRNECLIGTNIEEAEPGPLEAAKAEENDSSMMPPPPPPAAETAETTLMPPPPPMIMAPPAKPKSPPPKPKSPETNAMMPPPDKREMPPPNKSIDAPKDVVEPQKKKQKRQIGPMRPPARVQGTLAALKQAASHPAQSQGSQPSQSASQQGGASSQKPVIAFDPKNDVWKAPADQDGSGRTALHDKFKGRY